MHPAVNALARRGDGCWVGEMFDGVGFLGALAAAGCAPAGRRVYVAGSGGVGRSIGHALAGAGVEALTLHDVDPERAQTLARDIFRRYPAVHVAIAAAVPGETDLVAIARFFGLLT